MLVTQAAQSLQKAVLRRDNAHIGANRLDNHSRDLPFGFAAAALDRSQIVILRQQRILRRPARHSAGIRMALRQGPATGADQHTVVWPW